MGQAAVVGQKQQSLRILIQPSHREEVLPPQLRRQQIQHRLSPGRPRWRESTPQAYGASA